MVAGKRSSGGVEGSGFQLLVWGCGANREGNQANKRDGIVSNTCLFSLTSAATDSVVPLHFQFPPIRYLRAMVIVGVWAGAVGVGSWEAEGQSK